MEPFEFTSNGGGGEALPRRVKKRNATFYEVIKFGIHNIEAGIISICRYLPANGKHLFLFALRASVVRRNSRVIFYRTKHYTKNHHTVFRLSGFLSHYPPGAG